MTSESTVVIKAYTGLYKEEHGDKMTWNLSLYRAMSTLYPNEGFILLTADLTSQGTFEVYQKIVGASPESPSPPNNISFSRSACFADPFV